MIVVFGAARLPEPPAALFALLCGAPVGATGCLPVRARGSPTTLFLAPVREGKRLRVGIATGGGAGIAGTVARDPAAAGGGGALGIDGARSGTTDVGAGVCPGIGAGGRALARGAGGGALRRGWGGGATEGEACVAGGSDACVGRAGGGGRFVGSGGGGCRLAAGAGAGVAAGAGAAACGAGAGAAAACFSAAAAAATSG